jgi:hypothetical protein
MDGRSISPVPGKRARQAPSLALRIALHGGLGLLAILVPFLWEQAVRHNPSLARYNVAILAILGGFVVVVVMYVIFQLLFRDTNGTTRMIATMTTIAVFSFLLSAVSRSNAPLVIGVGFILIVFWLRRSALFVVSAEGET